MLLRLALILLAASAPSQPRTDFPRARRPVAGIVSNRWSDEADRDRAGEADTVIRAAGVQPGMTVADIGAGQGYYTLRLAKAVGSTGTVIAEDIVPRYVAELERRVRSSQAGNVRMVLGQPDDPALQPDTVDRAFMIHMYHEVAEPYALLWHLHGALRREGKVVVVDSYRSTVEHGTPPELLRCEFASVGFKQVGFVRLSQVGGYLAMFEPAAPRPDPSAIKPCS